MYVRPRHHNLPNLDLSKFHCTNDELFFTGGDQSTLASLLNLYLQLFRRMGNAVHLPRGNTQSLYDGTRYPVEQMDCPVKSVQEPTERHGHQQCHALGTGQTERFGNQFPDYNVQGTQEGESAGQRDGMGEKRGVRCQATGPNGLKYFRKCGFAKRADRQAGKGDARALPFATSCRTRDNRTATSENSVAAKKPFSATSDRTPIRRTASIFGFCPPTAL